MQRSEIRGCGHAPGFRPLTAIQAMLFRAGQHRHGQLKNALRRPISLELFSQLALS